MGDQRTGLGYYFLYFYCQSIKIGINRVFCKSSAMVSIYFCQFTRITQSDSINFLWATTLCTMWCTQRSNKQQSQQYRNIETHFLKQQGRRTRDGTENTFSVCILFVLMFLFGNPCRRRDERHSTGNSNATPLKANLHFYEHSPCLSIAVFSI